jgi:nucleotidyltransferase/DNA polymerase involved in DNA repair
MTLMNCNSLRSCRLSDNSKNEPLVILSEAKNLMLSKSYKTRFFGYHLRMTIVGQPVLPQGYLFLIEKSK